MSEEYLGTSELAAAVKAAMQASDAARERPTRGNAAEVPTERTIRYYLQQGMIPQPLGKRGLNLRFGRIHLLSLLAIKRLQESGLVNNSGIRELIRDKSESELEELLHEEIRTVTDPREVTRYQQMSQEDLREEFGTEVTRVDMMAPKKNPATEFFEKKLFGRPQEIAASQPLFSRLSSPLTDEDAAGEPVPVAAASAPPPMPAAAAPERTLSWQRHEIADGVEMHIREDVPVPPHSRLASEILDKVKRLLGL